MPGGRAPVLAVSCGRLRDASHPLEAGAPLADEHPRASLLAVAVGDGVFDPRAEFQLDAEHVRSLVAAGAKRGFCNENNSDEDELGDVVEGGGEEEQSGSDKDNNDNDGEDEEEGADALEHNAVDWTKSGVKGDPTRVMDRIIRPMRKGHGAMALFCRRLAHAMVLSNLKDSMAAKVVAARKWPHLEWAEVLFRRTR